MPLFDKAPLAVAEVRRVRY